MGSERLNLFKNLPRVPYHNESFGTMCTKVQVRDHLPWYDNVSDYARPHPCSLDKAIKQSNRHVSAYIVGLDLVKLKKEEEKA
jgi:hypothetical protein